MSLGFMWGLYLFDLFVDIFMLWLLLGYVFTCKKSLSHMVTLLVIWFIVLIGNKYLLMSNGRGTFATILGFLHSLIYIYITFVCFKEHWLKKVLLLVLFLAGAAITEVVATYLAEFLSGSTTAFEVSIKTSNKCMQVFLLIYIPCRMVHMLFMFIIGRMLKTTKNMIKASDAMCLLFPFGQVLVIYILYVGRSDYKIPTLFMIGLVVAGVADIIYVLIQGIRDKQASMEIETKEKLHMYELEKMKYEEMMKYDEQIAMLRHDFANQLATIEVIRNEE